MDREQQVLWLGLLLVAANFFFSGQFRTLWTVFITKQSVVGPPNLNIPIPIPPLGTLPLPINNPSQPKIQSV